jgi:hypothetical protein
MLTAKKDCYRLIQMVVLKNNPICRHLGCSQLSTVGHHIWKRDRMGTAFHPQAVFAVCQAHHAYAHAHPVSFMDLVRFSLGDLFYELEALSRQTIRYREADYKRIRLELTNMLAERR